MSRTPAAVGALTLALTVLPALAGCTDETKEKKSESGPPVVAPGKPGEKPETLSPEKARQRSGGDTKPNAADFTYVSTMIEHHKQAVVMSDLAPKRASSSSVRKLASRIGAGQEPEIKAMRGWLKQHRKASPEPGKNGSGGNEGHGKHGEHGGHGGHQGGPSMPGMATKAQLAQLRTAQGKAFDQLFLTLMATHHKGAVTMAVRVLEHGNDVRVEDMATEVMAQQRAEIKRMRKLG
jgi:uncharacterized protein (DUF305 family)